MVDKRGFFHGRGRRLRTHDPRFWRPVLYQLSYAPIHVSGVYHIFWFFSRGFCHVVISFVFDPSDTRIWFAFSPYLR